jgi:hypothetical protein
MSLKTDRKEPFLFEQILKFTKLPEVSLHPRGSASELGVTKAPHTTLLSTTGQFSP